MHKQTHKRAFYTLAGCIAALALCVAASLFLLTPAPKAQDVTIPGTRGDIYATVQLPGKLARGEELPLVVLCHGFTGSRSGDGHFAPLAADLAAASNALEFAFDFMEQAFEDGQEMVVFVNELALGPDSAPFLAENDCERFEQYSEKLLLHGGEDELLAELQRDDVRAEEHSAEF